jgi:hypothetical protein
MKKIISIFLMLGLIQVLFAQPPAPPTNLSGQDLRTWLKTNWFDGKLVNNGNGLGYDEARRQMYGYIYIEADNKVTCVYTGFKDDGGFITFPNPINTEHTIPQSFFNNAEPMVCDIHHLFPTHKTPNGTRGNFPFSEIPDNQTTKWEGINASGAFISQSNIPSTNINNFSEFKTNTYEPREDHKGNVARAVFYFFTMYPNISGLTINNLGDINTFYQWHLQDPPTQLDRERNIKIEEKQGNRNPYIDYPDLVARAWGFSSIAFANSEASIVQNNTSQTYQIPVALSLAPTSNVSVQVALDNTSTTALPSDYSFSTQTLTFTPTGNLTQNVSVNINSNTTSTTNRKLVFKLQNATNTQIGTNNLYTLNLLNTLTSIEKEEWQGLEIFPNPIDDFINIKNTGTRWEKLFIQNTQGKLLQEIKNESLEKIDLQHLPKGMYYFQFSNNAQKITKKVIKK